MKEGDWHTFYKESEHLENKFVILKRGSLWHRVLLEIPRNKTPTTIMNVTAFRIAYKLVMLMYSQNNISLYFI